MCYPTVKQKRDQECFHGNAVSLQAPATPISSASTELSDKRSCGELFGICPLGQKSKWPASCPHGHRGLTLVWERGSYYSLLRHIRSSDTIFLGSYLAASTSIFVWDNQLTRLNQGHVDWATLTIHNSSPASNHFPGKFSSCLSKPSNNTASSLYFSYSIRVILLCVIVRCSHVCMFLQLEASLPGGEHLCRSHWVLPVRASFLRLPQAPDMAAP